MRAKRVVDILAFVVVIPAVVIVKNLYGLQPALVVMVASLALIWSVGWALGERERRRIEAAVTASPERRADLSRALDEDAQAVVRLRLDETAPGYEDPNSVHVRTFQYPQTPEWQLRTMFFAAVGLASLPLVLLLTGNVRADQRGSAFLVGLLFLGSAGLVLFTRKWQQRSVRIGAFGIVEQRPFGTRVAIAWSELASVREQRWPVALRIDSSDGKRSIVVFANLEGYPQLVEMLVAELRRRGDPS